MGGVMLVKENQLSKRIVGETCQPLHPRPLPKLGSRSEKDNFVCSWEESDWPLFAVKQNAVRKKQLVDYVFMHRMCVCVWWAHRNKYTTQRTASLSIIIILLFPFPFSLPVFFSFEHFFIVSNCVTQSHIWRQSYVLCQQLTLKNYH